MSERYNPQDKFFKKAQALNYRARSVFKLEELDYKYHVLHPNMVVLDLGAAPGSWLQYTSKKIEPKGFALGLDLQTIDPIAQNVKTKVVDITNVNAVLNALHEEGYKHADIILADTAPSTTGIDGVDHAKSIELNLAVFEICKAALKPKGTAIMKVFDGPDFGDFLKKLKTHFTNVKATKVKATRERSKELYVICR